MKRDRKKGEGILTLRLAGAGDDGDVVIHYVVIKAGNGGVKVREFVDIFCTHPPKPRQSGR